MTKRHSDDWIKSFINYASIGEAPPQVYFWVGVATVAGALQRRVWIDQVNSKWLANFYIILVAPPGIVAKSTSASLGMNLLRQVKGIHFGPDVVTWQALVSDMADAQDSFFLNSITDGALAVPVEEFKHSSITIESSEFGNFLEPRNAEMVNTLIELWDGRDTFKKRTKTSGSDEIIHPWINMIACTTPSWINGSFPEHMIGGGFTSRCIVVYEDKKHKLVAYPTAPADYKEREKELVHDLEAIAQLKGEFKLTAEAKEWGSEWYKQHYENNIKQGHPNPLMAAFYARKQVHIHKLAMVLSAARGDSMTITQPDLSFASSIVTNTELRLERAFNGIGQTIEAKHLEALITIVAHNTPIEWTTLYRKAMKDYPVSADFEKAIHAAVQAKFIKLETLGGKTMVSFTDTGN